MQGFLPWHLNQSWEVGPLRRGALWLYPAFSACEATFLKQKTVSSGSWQLHRLPGLTLHIKFWKVWFQFISCTYLQQLPIPDFIQQEIGTNMSPTTLVSTQQHKRNFQVLLPILEAMRSSSKVIRLPQDSWLVLLLSPSSFSFAYVTG